jgi:hypothetical protein
MRALLLLIGLFLVFTPQSLKAEENKHQPVRIEIDKEAGHFTFIIDNEPAARLDKDGLHVLGSITYGGTLTDAGEEKQKQVLNAQETEAADE